MEVGVWSGGEEEGHERMRGSRLVLYKGYMRLDPSGSADEQEVPPRRRSGSVSFGPTAQRQKHNHNQRRRWRFRVRPKVRVLYSTISTLVRRLRDSYARVMLALVAKGKATSLLPMVGGSKKKRTSAIGNGSMFRSGSKGASGRDLSHVEVKYLDFIKRSVTDGELAYYTMSLRTTNLF